MPSSPSQNTLPSSIKGIAALCAASGADVQELQHRIAVLGYAYGLRPTSSTRPTPTTPRVAAGFSAGVTPAIRICRDLLEEGAQLAIFDPKVSAEQIAADLGVEALDG